MSKAIYFDIGTASVSSANLTKVIEFKNPFSYPINLKDLSLSPDTTFAGNGTFLLICGGQTSMTGGKSLPQALDIPLWTFENGEGLTLLSGESIEIWGSCSTGTGILTASILGGN